MFLQAGMMQGIPKLKSPLSQVTPILVKLSKSSEH